MALQDSAALADITIDVPKGGIVFEALFDTHGQFR